MKYYIYIDDAYLLAGGSWGGVEYKENFRQFSSREKAKGYIKTASAHYTNVFGMDIVNNWGYAKVISEEEICVREII